MASHAASAPDPDRLRAEPDRSGGEDDRLPVLRSKARTVPLGSLGVTEILFDRAGAASPFGDDVRFPLPVSELSYVHPTEDAFPEH
jgi:succinate dehydrogenase / fumarate reductase iron-sulfur subunit